MSGNSLFNGHRQNNNPGPTGGYNRELGFIYLHILRLMFFMILLVIFPCNLDICSNTISDKSTRLGNAIRVSTSAHR